MSRLAASSHGESRLRMLRIVRRGDRHDPRELTVGIRFEGQVDGGAAEAHGAIVPGEAVKSLVHQVARAHAGAELETFALALCARVFDAHRHLTRVRAEIVEQPWLRMEVGGKAQGQSFVLGGPELKTVAVTSNGTRTAVVAGIDQLVVMRTTGLLPRGAHTRSDDGSEDAVQPLLVGSLCARWTYGSADLAFGPCRHGVRDAILNTFALHAARSVQHTLCAIADVLLATYDEILDVTLTLQERPYRPADLFPAPIENSDELFVTAEEPLGIVEVRVERDPQP